MVALGGTLLNSGTINGGYGVNGGAGLIVYAGVMVNNGSIAGGAAVGGLGGQGGLGAYVGGGGTLTNTGTIAGGFGLNGAAGIIVQAGIVMNDGSIAGGSAFFGPGGEGGFGAYVGSGGTLTNAGTITGGNGGASYTGNGGGGGYGVGINGGTLIDSGLINGGLGGGTFVGAQGNPGGDVGFYGLAGTLVLESGAAFGGSGIVLANAAVDDALVFGASAPGTLSSGEFIHFTSATAVAGADWTLTGGVVLYAAPGAAGLTIDAGAYVTLENATVVGGSGTAQGGVGVYIDGGTLTTSGTIIGGVNAGGTSEAASVQFGSVASTLIVEEGALFHGQVIANAAVDDVLQLGGTSAAKLSGFDNKFLNFTSIDVGASWTVSGNPGGIGISTSATLTNEGIIAGGDGSANHLGGGVGVDLGAGGTLTNFGMIGGGLAYGTGRGGIGLAVYGQATNYGTITGGAGGNAVSGNGGHGGTGVLINGGTLIDDGTISGGQGGSATAGSAGVMGDAVQFGAMAGELLVEAGAVFNGVVQANANVADVLVLGGTGAASFNDFDATFRDFTNVTIGGNWFVQGGAGAVGIDIASGETLTNQGAITGGHSVARGNGGIGVDINTGGTVINQGSIGGGAGYGSATGPGNGGIGVTINAGAYLNNAGTVTGGSGGYQGGLGGTGVALSAGGTLTNTGTISGGDGGGAGSAGPGHFAGGDAGTGLAVAANAYVVNEGFIQGGAGGGGFHSGGLGGTGVTIGAGATVVNNVLDTISGGAGGYSHFARGANGGVGVYVNGGTLVSAGLIEGGAGGSSYDNHAGARGDAVQFGSLAGTLLLDPSASFIGDVVANAAVNDVLALAQMGGKLTGLGSAFTGFTTLDVEQGAAWNLMHANVLGAGTQLTDAGRFDINGSLADGGNATVSGTLFTSGFGNAQFASLDLAGGELSVGSSATLEIGGNAQPGTGGQVTIEAGAALSGFGQVARAAADNGGIVAQGGTLTLLQGASGTGTITVDTGATLVAKGIVNLSSIDLAASGATVVMAAGATLQATPLVGFGGSDVIDLRGIRATSLQFSAGTLTLDHGTQQVGTLLLTGAYTAADFVLSADGHGGTDIKFVAAAAMADFVPAGIAANPPGLAHATSAGTDNAVGGTGFDDWAHGGLDLLGHAHWLG